MRFCLKTGVRASAALIAAAATVGSASAQVEVRPLDGPSISGRLTGVANERVTLDPGPAGGVPFAELAEVRFPAPAAAPTTPESTVLLSGGSELPASTATVVDGTLKASAPGLGTITAPSSAVRAIRFRALTGEELARWEELANSEPEGDLVIIRRGERLDRLVGSLGGVGEETVTFLLNGREVPLPRGRADFIGVVFRGDAVEAKPVAVVRPHMGGGLRAKELSSDAAGDLELRLVDGPTLTVSASGVASIDFAAGSVTPLADLPTRGASDETAGWADEPWPVGRNVNLEGDPIRIAEQAYERGLVLHAPATLEWRLPKDAGRLRAIVGIEDARRALGVGEVTLTVTGDGRELFSRRITHADEPVPLDVDLTGVRTLAIAVGVGDDPFAGDHLALGNARITQ